MRKCVECGSERFKAGEVEHEAVVDGRTYRAKVPAELCVKCGEDYTTAADLGRFELAVARQLADRGPIGGEGLRFMRGVLGLQAQDFAETLGVTPEHLSRWENGRREIDRNTWLVAGDLVVDFIEGKGRTDARLAALRKPLKRKTVDIELEPARTGIDS